MKKILSLVLVLSMVLGSFGFVFAAEEADFSRLTENNILLGDAEGNLMLDQQLTRAQFAVFALRLKGFEDDEIKALDEKADFTDVAADAWFAPYIGLAAKEGLMSGMGDGTFAPKANVTYVQVLTVLLRSLGHDTTGLAWPMGYYAAAVTAGLVDADVAVGEEVTRAQMAEAMEITLDLPMVGEEITLAQDLGIEIILVVESYVVNEDGTAVTFTMTDGVEVVEEVELEANVEAEVAFTYEGKEFAELVTWDVELLEVVSVKVLNLAQVEVVFNREVDAITATTATNYTFDAARVIVDADLSLAADAKTVTINLVGSELGQQEEFTLSIANVATAADAAMVMADFESDTITAFDATIPVILGVELTGPTTFDITFSEPVYNTDPATFSVLVNNGAFGVVTASLVDGSTAHTVTLAAELAEADYTVTVSGVEDAAGFDALNKEFTLTYVKDTSLPTVAVVSATQKEVVVEFSKEVNNVDDVTGLNFYHTFSAWNPDTVTNNGDNTFTLAFDTFTIPAGTTSFVVLVNDGTNDIADNWGNVMAADAMLSITVTADDTKPAVSSVDFIDESTVQITFSEDVPAATTEDEANYVIKTATSGTVVETGFTASYDSADPFVVTLAFDAPLATGAYTVTISGIKDNALTQNEMDEFVGTFTVTDATAPTITSAISVNTADGTPEYIYVTFSEIMNTEDVLNVANYEWGADFAGKTALPIDTVITIFGDASKVRIELPDVTTFLAKLYVAPVNDAIGNQVTGLLTEVAITLDTPPVVTDVKTVALNQLELTVNKELSTIVASDFVVTTAVYALPAVAASFSNNATDGISVITLTLDANNVLAGEGELPTKVEVVATNTLSITGTAMATVDDVDGTRTDGIAPVLSTIETDDLVSPGNGQIDTIVLTYTEDMHDSYFTPDTYTVAGYVVTDVVELGGVVTITVTELIDTPDTGATPEVVQVLDIYDNDGNILLAADYDVAVVVTVDGAAPAVDSSAIVSGTVVTVTFTEVVDEATAEAAAYTILTAAVDDTEVLTSAVLSADGLTVTLTFTGAVIVSEDTVTVPA
ncbi:S-layer homology domain-containing protein, partial [Alkaliphilus transvaalensis]|nr:S-layer homology domain-containing protein [Alkaliphilus transvaalensis]